MSRENENSIDAFDSSEVFFVGGKTGEPGLASPGGFVVVCRVRDGSAGDRTDGPRLLREEREVDAAERSVDSVRSSECGHRSSSASRRRSFEVEVGIVSLHHFVLVVEPLSPCLYMLIHHFPGELLTHKSPSSLHLHFFDHQSHVSDAHLSIALVLLSLVHVLRRMHSHILCTVHNKYR